MLCRAAVQNTAIFAWNGAMDFRVNMPEDNEEATAEEKDDAAEVPVAIRKADHLIRQ